MTSVHRTTIVISCHPAEGALAKEALDAALAAAVFEHAVTVAFCGDGVYQLLQPTEATLDKTIANSWAAAPLYEIEQLLVDAADLEQRGLQSAQLIDEAVVVDSAGITAVLRQASSVMSF